MAVDGKPGIRGTQHDAVGITVEVERGSRSVFTAHMLSVDCQEELTLEGVERYSILPVLLTSTATGPVARAVTGLVERFFDAVIGKISVSQIDLKWMLAAWVGLGTGDEEKKQPAAEAAEPVARLAILGDLFNRCAAQFIVMRAIDKNRPDFYAGATVHFSFWGGVPPGSDWGSRRWC